ncbi:hypothetical protein LTR08_005166 [Meristemomyces frigidus]|nr:hypothetical protein LTR08_005166 [Meristemomyces frigidus]
MKLTGVEGLEVTLRMHGADLQEYDDESGPLMPSNSAAYVEASGAEFSVHIGSQSRQLKSPAVADVILCYVYLDGKKVTGDVCNTNTTANNLDRTVNGVTENRDDGPTEGYDTEAFTELGEAGYPFAVFTFKYRSRRDLQIEGVISREPTPVPLEERDPDDLTPEEARELVRLLRAKQKQTAVKSEFKKEKRTHSQVIDVDDDDDDDDDVTISSGNYSRKRHCSSRDSGVEIIDLSDD